MNLKKKACEIFQLLRGTLPEKRGIFIRFRLVAVLFFDFRTNKKAKFKLPFVRTISEIATRYFHDNEAVEKKFLFIYLFTE
jgi:hypothetical protein